MLRQLARLTVSLGLLAIINASARGDVLISDINSNTIFRYADNGALIGPFITSAQATSYNLQYPSGVVYNPNDGLVYVSSQHTNQIMRFTLAGAPAGTVGGNPVYINNMTAIVDPVNPIPPGLLYNPSALRISAAGDLFVGRTLEAYYNPGAAGHSTVDRFNISGASGTFQGSVMSGFNNTTGLAFRPDGTLYAGSLSVASGGTVGGFIDKLVGTTQSNLIPSFFGGGSLISVGGITLGQSDDMYVVDTFIGVVHHYGNISGSPTVLADFISTSMTGPGNLQTFFPADMTFVNGIAWVASPGDPAMGIAGKVTRYSVSGGVATYIDSLTNPLGIPLAWSPAQLAIVPVPEPGTLALLGSAIVTGYAIRRRRKKSA